MLSRQCLPPLSWPLRSSRRARKPCARIFTESAAGDAPGIALEVSEDGRDVVLERRGLSGVSYDDGAYSVAVNVSCFDVTIDERLTFGHGPGATATGAVVRLECLGPERYHILYRSETLGRNCAFTLRLRPGVRLERELV